MALKVFLSWSGQRSKLLATSLHSWLPDVVSNTHTWLSASDIGAGARWNHEIQEQLATTTFGIVCVTRENLQEPWLHFEAGALAKGVDKARVCPFLLGLTPADVPEGPLSQFQMKRTTLEDTWALIQSVNLALGDLKDPEDRLRRRFDSLWPTFQESLSSIPGAPAGPAPARSPDQKLDDILATVRDISRNITDAPSGAAIASQLRLRAKELQEEMRDPVKLRGMVEQMLLNGISAEFKKAGLTVTSYGADAREDGTIHFQASTDTATARTQVLAPGFEKMTGNDMQSQIVLPAARDLIAGLTRNRAD